MTNFLTTLLLACAAYLGYVVGEEVGERRGWRRATNKRYSRFGGDT